MHGDHIGGNEAMAKAGRTRAGGNVVGDIGQAATATASIIAHENALNRMVDGESAAAPPPRCPTETFFNSRKDMLFNGEAVQMIHQPSRAHRRRPASCTSGGRTSSPPATCSPP